MKAAQLVGQRFGRLTVQSVRSDVSDRFRTYLQCICECGTAKEVRTDVVTTKNLARRVVSCGCYARDQKRKPVTKSYRAAFASESRGREVRLHVLRAERALGKPLPPKAIVHHADGSVADDAPLVICQDQAYHMLLHRRMRVKAAGGDPNFHEAVCAVCRCPFRRSEMNGGYCRPCRKTVRKD